MNSLKSYLHRFTHLRVARSRQHGEAPYKPALLLAVLDGIEDGSILDNRIYITPELLAAFRSLCRDLSTSALFRAKRRRAAVLPPLGRRVLAPAHLARAGSAADGLARVQELSQPRFGKQNGPPQ